MRDALVLDLADCTEFRQTLQARPPRIVHATAILLVALLATALVWSAATRANLVVRAPGRVRPVSTPVKVFNAARGEVLSAGVGGQVVEVNARVGDVVRRGAVLVRLDTERLDNEIARQRRTHQAGVEELERLARLQELLTGQHEAMRAKVEAELAQAREAVRLARERRGSEIRLAELAMETAQGEEGRLRRLQQQRVVAPVELIKAVAQAREAQERLDKARLPVEEGSIAVLERSLELAERDHAAKREELELKRAGKRTEVEAARTELANRELERRQAVLSAPMDGVVTSGDLKVGDLLEAGKPAVEIAQRGGFRFEAEVPSEEVGRLRLGMPARIKLDAYDYQRYGTLPGTVCFLSPDSGLSQGQRQAIYVVKIALAGDQVGRGAYRGRVKLGMGGQAEIITGRESLLTILVKRIRQSISLG
jgi:hemolysin D